MGTTKFMSNKRGIQQAKEIAGAQQHTAIDAIEGVKRAEAIAQANERAKMAVWQMMGQSGTFGSQPGSMAAQNEFTQAWENANNVDDPTSLFDTSGLGLSQPDQGLRGLGMNDPNKNSILGIAREGVLDPESYARAIASSPQFRIQSQRVAESEQLLNQEGPAWDMLENSVLGIIREGSALEYKESVRKLKNQYAKGGTARRAAAYEFQERLAAESALRSRTHETWQANLQLFEAVRKNADSVRQSTNDFMANLPLVNDSYRNAVMAAAELNIHANSYAGQAVLSSYQTRMTQQPRAVGMKLAEGLTKVAGSAVLSAIPYVGPALGGAFNSAMGSALKGGGFQNVWAQGGGEEEGSDGGGILGGMMGGGLNDLMKPISDKLSMYTPGLTSWLDSTGLTGGLKEGVEVPMAPKL